MLNELTIPAKPKRPGSQDQALLYAEAIAHIRDLSHNLWTDYNLHDPGINTLEVLSYALTDLGYRADMPVEDLLATATDNDANMRELFYSARQILPGRALTHRDYRKLLIDLPGVKNAWLKPATLTYYADKINARLMAEDSGRPGVEPVSVQGLYDVLIDFMENVRDSGKSAIIDRVKNLLHANRNLCEDFVSFDEVQTQMFLICGEIDLKPEADTIATHAHILWEVQNYLAPNVQNYSLKEMQEKSAADGHPIRIEDIFQGPLLRCGFIPDEELDRADLRTEIRLSDLINIIMDIPGVLAVREFIINPTAADIPLDNKWLVAVEPSKKPQLDAQLSRLVFYKRGMPIAAGKNQALVQLEQRAEQQTLKLETPIEDDLPIPLGRYRNTGDYLSLQNHFPAIYGLGEQGLPSGADNKREAQALQFSAYLLFFDQLLANYMAQLAQIRELFSTDTHLKQTYFHQMVDSFRLWRKLYTMEPDHFLSAMEAQVEQPQAHMEHRNRFLDHLIARFAEGFSEFAEIMHSAFGSSPAILAGYKCDFIKHYPTISADRGLAYNYQLKQPEDIWNSSNISGLEKRLCKLLGITNSDRRNLSELPYDIYEEVDDTPGDEFRFRVRHKTTGAILLSSSTNYATPAAARAEMRSAILFGKLRHYYQTKITSDGRFFFNIVDDTHEVLARRIQYFTSETALNQAIDDLITYLNTTYADEGLYLIENLLLRPEQGSDPFLPICVDPHCNECSDSDPYSYRIHIILPAYGARFADRDFRRFAENLIRREVPAHILPKICWISRDQMAALEGHYQSWLQLKSGRTLTQRAQRLSDFINSLYAAKNVYPTERLRDCDSDENQRKFVLNRTAIGSFTEEDDDE